MKQLALFFVAFATVYCQIAQTMCQDTCLGIHNSKHLLTINKILLSCSAHQCVPALLHLQQFAARRSPPTMNKRAAVTLPPLPVFPLVLIINKILIKDSILKTGAG